MSRWYYPDHVAVGRAALDAAAGLPSTGEDLPELTEQGLELPWNGVRWVAVLVPLLAHFHAVDATWGWSARGIALRSLERRMCVEVLTRRTPRRV